MNQGLKKINVFATISTFFCFSLFSSDSSHDILLVRYVSAIMDTPSDFDWENLPEFANFNRVTVGSLVDLYRLDQHDIIRLVENLVSGHSATGIDYKANQLTKYYCAVKKRCVQGNVLQGSSDELAGLPI